MQCTYDDPIQITYKYSAASLTGGAATFGRFIGPAGKVGRVISLTAVNTTGVTVAAAKVIVGAAGVNASLTVPISAINLGVSISEAARQAASAIAAQIPKDTVTTVGTDGAATAGAADVTLVVGWF